MEDGDTEESLKAEHLAITGKAYQTEEQEAADRVAAHLERRDAEEQARLDTDLEIIEEAKANGFMDCRAIRDALGYDQPKTNGSHYDSVGVAYRFISEAGESIVYLLPNDGRGYYIGGERKTIPLASRSGIWPDDFDEVAEYKYKWDDDRAAREQESWDDAQAQKDAYDAQKAEELAGLIARQQADRVQRALDQAERDAQLETARNAEIRLLIAEARAVDAQIIPADRRVSIIAALRSYTGPLTKNGLPKRRPLNDHAEFKIQGWEKRECWPEAQAE